ncbi:sideroflexin-3 isoform X2 [Diabrotica virgifera virgifera]|nr:sideroflexin-3 isoform X2 [Diabrotica virgifera virgifera]XP_028130134.1 sideroflexin-3 isoform X2 [Diabrotica virgifera virgifera]XP_028130135.1 sideroflexin-3 isoform X2 [Diabrotica virgifera virgifera]
MASVPKGINIDEPRYDQKTYVGRAKHFFITTNPLNIFASSKSLDEAKSIVDRYRRNERIEGLTEDKLWRAKNLYDSAFHPDTGEKMFVLGRMSAQVPSNMLITGGMITFYRSIPAVVFWQWLNQSFNALVNYSNRSGDIVQTDQQILTSYLCATTGAVGTALGLNSLTKSMPSIIGRMVPFVAVAAANCINIPMMRAQELRQGTPVYDENNNKLGYSKRAAQSGIAQVVFSRVCMALPGMVCTPIIMNSLERKGFLRKYPKMNLPVSIGILGFCLTFATPLACAVFKQKATIQFKKLEPELQEQIKAKLKVPPICVFYNKGL